MVCPRCIAAVEHLLDDMNIPFHGLKLGEIALYDPLPSVVESLFALRLKGLGFELLHSEGAILVSKIKDLIITQIHHSSHQLQVNWSTYLADNLNRDYSSLSRLFSSVEGITIEKFIVRQRIEKAKEFIFYEEHTLSEIAHALSYSSVAHLSAQFKKETGMSPSEFKKSRDSTRSSIDR